jgi:hypothetical protein
MPHTYKNLIFTNHAYDRIKSRSISNHAIYETIRNPDKQQRKSGESVKYIRRVTDRNYHVVATYKEDQKKYLVISAWVRGEDDRVPLLWRIVKFTFKTIWMILKKLW